MNQIRISDLNTNDVIEFQNAETVLALTYTAIVNRVYWKTDALDFDRFVAEIETNKGKKLTIDDNYDFIRVNKPFSRKVDMVHQPNHYTSNDGIDLIEFCKQQFTEEEFRGAMKFTQLRYALRTGRKENDIQDQQKLKEYADRFIEVLEE